MRYFNDDAYLNANETIQLILLAALDENTAPGNERLEMLCRKLALNRYGGGAKDIRDRVALLSRRERAAWASEILDGYITNSDVFDIMQG